MKYLKSLLATALLVLFAGSALAQDADRILGVYKAIGEATKAVSNVRFYKTGDTYEARIIWLQDPTDAEGKPLLDALNPDPELRGVKADNIRIIWGLNYDAKKKMWTGGTVYNPVDGKSYDVQVSFDRPDRLKVRGYMGAPMLGKNFFWDKVQ